MCVGHPQVVPIHGCMRVVVDIYFLYSICVLVALDIITLRQSLIGIPEVGLFFFNVIHEGIGGVFNKPCEFGVAATVCRNHVSGGSRDIIYGRGTIVFVQTQNGVHLRDGGGRTKGGGRGRRGGRCLGHGHG